MYSPGFAYKSVSIARWAGLLTKLTNSNSFTQFPSLPEASVLDEAGISYRLPDHVYAEDSSRW